MGQTEGRRELAVWAAACVLEQGDVGHCSTQVLLQVQTETVDGGGVCGLQGGVAWVGLHALEDCQSQFETQESEEEGDEEMQWE